jgi:hypothetical protein
VQLHWQQWYKILAIVLCVYSLRHVCCCCCCCRQVTTSKEKKGPRAKELKAKEVLQANFKVGSSQGGRQALQGPGGTGTLIL